MTTPLKSERKYNLRHDKTVVLFEIPKNRIRIYDNH